MYSTGGFIYFVPFLKHITSTIMDIFFPRCCIICNEFYSPSTFNYDYLCIKCEKILPKPSDKNICIKCRAFLGEYVLSRPICQLCKKYRHLFKKLITPLYYKDKAEEFIKEFKFGQRFYIGQLLTQLLITKIKEELENSNKKIDYITYIPMTYWEEYRRGFNQAEFVARIVGKSIGVPVVKLLKKVRSTKHQMELSFFDRQKNVKDAFVMNKKFHYSVRSKNIIIVDDIYTTGSTISECCRVLKDYGAKQIFPAVLARNIIKNP